MEKLLQYKHSVMAPHTYRTDTLHHPREKEKTALCTYTALE